MYSYKICVYAICKNESHFIERWVKSMSEADLVIVCDTGSTDNSIEKLKENGVITHCIQIAPWRFDEARNTCLAFIPHDVDICVCTDLDEVFEPGWRKILEAAWKPTTSQFHYTFVWNLAVEGIPSKTSIGEKIHAREGFKWVYPVHEILEYTGYKPYECILEPNLSIYHYPNPCKSRQQYLSLLEYSAKLYPNYDRNIHYLGREYLCYGKYEECIETLIKHLSLPSATWLDERCSSMRFIAMAYITLDNYTLAKIWLYRAIAEAPHTREPYLDMVKLAYDQKDWPTVYHMVEEALKISNPTGSYIDSPECWGYLFYDFGAISCFHLGMKDTCLWFSHKALELSPHDIRLQDNLKIALERFEG